jgi:8-oxo-dGTP pyrophosphatase MutT (NUDIX family)
MKIKEVAGNYSMTGTRRMQAPGNIRSGFQVTGNRSSLENDLESEEWPKRQDREVKDAAICYVQQGNKILAVSRGLDAGNMNMPGGGIESGETPRDAAVRELYEETGIRASEIEPLFKKNLGDKSIYFFKVTKFSGKVRSSDEGIAAWVDPGALLRGQYSDSFLDVISHL